MTAKDIDNKPNTHVAVSLPDACGDQPWASLDGPLAGKFGCWMASWYPIIESPSIILSLNLWQVNTYQPGPHKPLREKLA